MFQSVFHYTFYDTCVNTDKLFAGHAGLTRKAGGNDTNVSARDVGDVRGRRACQAMAPQADVARVEDGFDVRAIGEANGGAGRVDSELVEEIAGELAGVGDGGGTGHGVS